MIKTYDYKEEVNNTYFNATEEVSFNDLVEGDFMLIKTQVTGNKNGKNSERYAKFMGKTEKFFYQVDYCDASFGGNKGKVNLLTKVVEAKDNAFSKRKRTSIDKVISVRRVDSFSQTDVVTYHTPDMEVAMHKMNQWDLQNNK